MSKKQVKNASMKPAPISAEELDRYAWDLVERGLASPAILGPRSKTREHTRKPRSTNEWIAA